MDERAKEPEMNGLLWMNRREQMSTMEFENTVVTNMVEEALECYAEKAGLKDKEQARDAFLADDCRACDYVRYVLSRKLGEYLGSVDDSVRAVYTFEPEQATGGDVAIPERPNLSPGINLIARVSHKDSDLSSVAASLRSALMEECRRLGCPNCTALCSELDIQIVDEDEVQEGIGYGALINSLHMRPMEVWCR